MREARLTNLFDDLPQAAPNEQVIALLSAAKLRIERIVSTGQASPPGFWYDQPQAEWVVVITGSARLQIAGESQSRTLRAGDFIEIGAHVRHRVEWTDPASPTIWLAVHYG